MKKPLPLALLQEASARFPTAWELLEMVHKDNGVKLPEWDDCCYVPIAATIAVVTNGARMTPKALMGAGNWPAVLAALAPWRLSKEVYVFDPDLEGVLYEQSDMDIPGTVFFALPFQCIYIQCNLCVAGKQCDGFFVHIEHDTNNHDRELRLLFLGENLDVLPFPVHLDAKTIQENWERTKSQASKFAKKIDSDVSDLRDDLLDAVSKALQLVLFICASNAEIAPHSEQQFITRRTARIKDKYAEIRKWNVGVRFGNAIRANRKNVPGETVAGERNSPRPHSRRAHWHHYWTGPRDKPEERKLVLKWLPPTWVGEVDLDDAPIVMRRAENPLK